MDLIHKTIPSITVAVSYAQHEAILLHYANLGRLDWEKSCNLSLPYISYKEIEVLLIRPLDPNQYKIPLNLIATNIGIILPKIFNY